MWNEVTQFSECLLDLFATMSCCTKQILCPHTDRTEQNRTQHNATSSILFMLLGLIFRSFIPFVIHFSAMLCFYHIFFFFSFFWLSFISCFTVFWCFQTERDEPQKHSDGIYLIFTCLNAAYLRSTAFFGMLNVMLCCVRFEYLLFCSS